MFQYLIVSQELLPIRDAASQGDLDAMYKLAEAAIHGKGMKQCGVTACDILDAMIEKDEIREDIYRFVNTYILMVHGFSDQYDKGLIDDAEFAHKGCFYMELAIRAMTKFPYDYWPIDQLQSCLEWIARSREFVEEECQGG